MPPENKWEKFKDYFSKRKCASYFRVGLLLKKYYFYVQNYIKWQAGEELKERWLSNFEEKLQVYFLLNASTLCEKCKILLLFEEDIIERRSNYGKPDIIFINEVPEIICIETKKIGTGKQSRRKRRKIEEQVNNYQRIMANMSGLPNESVHGIMFTDDNGVRAGTYYEGEGLKPPFFHCKAIMISDKEREEWERDWFNKDVLEGKFKQIAKIMGIEQSFFSNKLLANYKYSEEESWFNWVWVALYLKEDLNNKFKKLDFKIVIDHLKNNFLERNK